MGITEYIKVGSFIKELRLSKGYTAKEFAKKIHVPYSTYSNYENNNREPNLDVLQKICDNLGVTIDELLRFSTLPLELRDSIVDALLEDDVMAIKKNINHEFYNSFNPSDFSQDELNDIKQYIEFIKFKRNSLPHSATE